jgi:hypothetical protein
MKITGKFTSVWDNGSITTPATLDTETGKLSINSVEVNDSFDSLVCEHFESSDGELFDVCEYCHDHVLKEVTEFVNCTEVTTERCTDPDCENNRPINKINLVASMILTTFVK